MNAQSITGSLEATFSGGFYDEHTVWKVAQNVWRTSHWLWGALLLLGAALATDWAVNRTGGVWYVLLFVLVLMTGTLCLGYKWGRYREAGASFIWHKGIYAQKAKFAAGILVHDNQSFTLAIVGQDSRPHCKKFIEGSGIANALREFGKELSVVNLHPDIVVEEVVGGEATNGPWLSLLAKMAKATGFRIETSSA